MKFVTDSPRNQLALLRLAYDMPKLARWTVSFICGNKMPTRCNRWFLLQILLLAQHVSFSIFTATNTTGSNHLYNTLELLMMGIVVPESCWASNKICNKNHLLPLVGILFPHINDDARSKSHQICKFMSSDIKIQKVSPVTHYVTRYIRMVTVDWQSEKWIYTKKSL